MHLLPDDLVVALAEFLGGISVLMLSHTNRRLYILLSSAQVWGPRVRSSIKREPNVFMALPRCPEKYIYATRRMLLSKPLDVRDRPVIHREFVRDRQQTISIRFCFLPQYAPDRRPGQIVNVFCSTNQQLNVSVPVGQWCHLAWVVDSREEVVYFNGAQVISNPRDSRKHCYIWDGELRTNFFGLPSEPLSRGGSEVCGFVFHGLLADFHIWDHHHIDMQRLADGEIGYCDASGVNCLDFKFVLTKKWISSVFSTQPHENIGEILPVTLHIQKEPHPPQYVSRSRHWWPWKWQWSWRLFQ